jgi:hypothetical protein
LDENALQHISNQISSVDPVGNGALLPFNVNDSSSGARPERFFVPNGGSVIIVKMSPAVKLGLPDRSVLPADCLNCKNWLDLIISGVRVGTP